MTWLPAGIGTVVSGLNSGPDPTHQVPDTTMKKRSLGWKCGRLILPGQPLQQNGVRPGLGRIALQHGGAIARWIVLPCDLVRKLETDNGRIERRLRRSREGKCGQGDACDQRAHNKGHEFLRTRLFLEKGCLQHLTQPSVPFRMLQGKWRDGQSGTFS